MINFLRRFWPRRIYAQPLLTAPAHPYTLLTPISLSERKPGPGDCDERGRCWYWDPATDPATDGAISWQLTAHPLWHTHWLPASVQLLPARCCPPEVQ